ncbi:hypothetical protein CRG98_028574 [Punica granatum]|uniref:Uncharacterized protein n=1 Tax=Punica granatum TaxID=22663 RepID=A0A2I0J477_PUNGR|nr:hypothetical protein CRG98_028574 [Punica granatum]
MGLSRNSAQLPEAGRANRGGLKSGFLTRLCCILSKTLAVASSSHIILRATMPAIAVTFHDDNAHAINGHNCRRLGLGSGERHRPRRNWADSAIPDSAQIRLKPRPNSGEAQA